MYVAWITYLMKSTRISPAVSPVLHLNISTTYQREYAIVCNYLQVLAIICHYTVIYIWLLFARYCYLHTWIYCNPLYVSLVSYWMHHTVYSTFTCILTVSTYCTIAVRITGTHHTVYLYTVILTYCTITLFTSSNLFAICTAGWMLIAFHCHCICTLTVMIQLALTSPYSVGSFGLNSQKKTSLHTCGGCSVLLCECREVYKPLDRNLYYVECILVSLIFTLLTLSVPSWLALAWLVSSVSHYIR